jgi:hypothetical protein
MAREGDGAPDANRQRASGRVSLGDEARLRLELVPLGSISQVHPAIQDRDVRLDLVAGSLSQLSDWTAEALEVLMWASPAWVMKRGRTGAEHHVVICGGQFLPSLRMLRPPDSLIPVLLVDTKFQAPRLLQMAAAHAAAVAEAALCRSEESIRRMIADAGSNGAAVLRPATATPKAARRRQRAAGTED